MDHRNDVSHARTVSEEDAPRRYVAYEARLISERTKAAFATAKARGRKFGNPDSATHRFSDAARKAQVRAIREKAKARALDYLPLFCELRDRGVDFR